MSTLSISSFTCIDSAEVKLSPMTLLIGPQASGKSVISKLFFFFITELSHRHLRAEEANSIARFSELAAEEFSRWFPPSAWGLSPFRIRFSAGPIEITVSRRRATKAGPSDRVNVTFSDFFSDAYSSLVDRYQQATAEGARAGDPWELNYKIRTSSDIQFAAALGDEFIARQMFIPAGRSFFTSLGKIISVFDHGGLLDAVTLRFGRAYGGYADRYAARVAAVEAIQKNHGELTQRLFGGAIRFPRGVGQGFIESDDGRKVPFSALSSGQQELLPLWITLAQFAEPPRPVRQARPVTTAIFIEEPEAHLFPSAQSAVLEYLAGIVSGTGRRSRMMITTHSPYVLTKVNNLVLAGKALLGTREQMAATSEVVSRRSWLRPSSLGAYAIRDRKVASIMDDEGYIDGDYLDAVSSDISEETLRLLEIVGEIEQIEKLSEGNESKQD